jgi:hypothetical protein
MSTKGDPDDDDYDGEFCGGEEEEDDDEDDEDEFIPGAEEEAEEDDHDGEGAGLELMQGKISIDIEGKLVLQGEGFNLQSSAPFDSSSPRSSLLLVGPWQLAGADPKLKAPPRRIKLSIAAAAAATAKVGKRSETEQHDDDVGPKTMLSFEIQGTEETTGDETIQFFGQVVIGTEPHDYTCRLRRVITKTTMTTTAGSTPPAAAAAAKKSSHNDDNDDDDADGEDADDDVDFDELAALHEEAGMSVDAVLNKRYRESTGDGDKGEGSASNKRGKTETDDEEDIEF